MTYSLRFEERPEYLFAEVRAEHQPTPDEVRRYMTELHDMCVRRGHRHLLIKRDIPAAFPVCTYFGVSSETVPILHGIRTAWLNPYSWNHEALGFATLVATNRGALYALFNDLEAAEKWLGKENHDDQGSLAKRAA
jgi:hypothetical protein